ncbi:unnamed protein product [Cylicocyclus nassatus]|uniref:Metalloendopeptidase n=1 Tax=Cylicocyclus nassatus TaxID=53992 RepID=A0AA36M5R3_CYLNA|nr:unnamed protein product [Cylicocyclus nassatus]
MCPSYEAVLSGNMMRRRMIAVLVLFLCATSAMTQQFQLWNQYPESNGNYIVPYKFTGTYSPEQLSMITTAMQKIADNTCVEFKRCTDEEEFVDIVNKIDGSCGANVGRTGEKRIYLESNENENCMNEKTVMVNLLHSLGLSFEHQRVDRDKYITVHFENIADPHLRLFLSEADLTQNYLSVPYDYLSIMHGEKNAYAKPGTTTIETLDPTYQDQIGTATEPSAHDYEKINLLFKCDKH